MNDTINNNTDNIDNLKDNIHIQFIFFYLYLYQKVNN